MSPDRVAVVTGGASGLGAAIGRRLAADHTVVIADVDVAGATAVVDEIVGAGGSALAVPADVTDEEAVRDLMGAAAEAGPLGALVLSAAVESTTPLLECSDEEWERVLAVDLTGPFLCMKHGIPRMAAAGGGAVVAMGSTLGLMVAPGHPAYCAAKGALVNLCKQAAIEHARDGVRVNVVAPSACESGLFVRMAASAADPGAVVRSVARHNPMGRLGTEAEVAETVAFLVSPGAAYISGAVIPLDGGLAARRIV